MKPLLTLQQKKLPASRPLALSALTALAILFAVPHAASAQTVVTQFGTTTPHRLSPETLRQIAALEAEADARTPAQMKVSSQLLYTLKRMRGLAIAPGVPTLRTSAAVDGAGMTQVDIDGTISPALLTAIQQAGGKVIGKSVQFGQVRVLFPLSSVEALAALPDVRQIKPAAKYEPQNPVAMHSGVNLMPRKAELLTHLPSLLPQAGLNIFASRLPGINFMDAAAASPNAVGSVDDEADATHEADSARSVFGVDGNGIKVGIISDSLDNGNGVYNDAVNSGDVSPVTVISGQDGGAGGAEGLAMLEDVHHLAPGAQLYFATGEGGSGQFASNIIALQQAGCKVIIDDLAGSDEPPFQDDIIAQAINTVTANGVMYFSCAANFGNLYNGTASVWEGDFSSNGDTSSGDGVAHQFNKSNGDEINQVQFGNKNGTGDVVLFWSDPLGKSSNDYDLFILDQNFGLVASSTNRQTGSQDPFETAPAATGDYIVIVQHSGATRYLHVDLADQNSILHYATNDRTRGHNAAANAFCVAATPATTGQDGNPAGPYPNPFNSSDVVETFSDDGPRHVFFSPSGTPFTSSLTSTGGEVLYKPDFTAADGTSNTLTPNEVGYNSDGTPKEALSPFFGTSCAAPHAGAIAALVLSYNSHLTRAQLSSILKNSATDIMGSGYDLNSGTGILNAYKALQNTPSSAVATTVHVANVSGTAGQSVTLSATLTATSGGGLSGKTLTFHVDNASGNATTNSSGIASGTYTIPTSDAPGGHTITVSFAGDTADNPSSGTGTLTVSAASSPYQVRYFPRVGKESRMVGGQFQGSTNNSTWTTLYTVTATPADAYTTASVSTDPASFRYLRYLAPNGSYGNVAEVEFDSHGTKLTGTGFGTAGSYNNDGFTFAKALDGSTSTYFDAPAPGNGDFVGIDRNGTSYTKLTGTNYGTPGSYNNDGLTFMNAFDGSLSTYFDAPAPGNGDTVGLDLGASNQKVVTRLDFCPRSGYAGRMVGGVFQGSNGHGVFTTLYTVSSAPASGVLTRVVLSNTTAYRYVQYVAPNGSYGNVAEVEFDTSP